MIASNFCGSCVLKNALIEIVIYTNTLEEFLSSTTSTISSYYY